MSYQKGYKVSQRLVSIQHTLLAHFSGIILCATYPPKMSSINLTYAPECPQPPRVMQQIEDIIIKKAQKIYDELKVTPSGYVYR